MKSSQHAESTQSAPSRYAPSVPMSVYRELATELRANKAVIDSLNSRNHQLMQQNQRLKQEIHNVVQATLSLGQFAGVARQANPEGFSQGFPSAIAPDTLSRLVDAQRNPQDEAPPNALKNSQSSGPDIKETEPEAPDLVREIAQAAAMQAAARRPQPPIATPPQPSAPPRQRSPRPIQSEASADRGNAPKRTKARSPERETVREAPPKRKPASKVKAVKAVKAKTPKSARPVARQASNAKADALAIPSAQAMGKLFTEQSGEYRSSVMESGEEKEIGGIWLALSIVLIIVTAFGAGFLIMKPLLNER